MRLQLYPDAGGNPWDVQDARIGTVQHNVNLATGEYIGWTIPFAFGGKASGVGSITRPDGTSV